jgi:hypothetical protein
MVRYTKPEAIDVGVEEAIDTKWTYVVKIDNWFGN